MSTGPRELSFLEAERPCSYLPAETASLEYRISTGLTPYRYGELLIRGWRRHGLMLFRPKCPRCTQCRSLRVPVAAFRPSKSQRRAFQRNSSIESRVRPASVSPDHVALYNAYHADMAERRGWRPQAVTAEDYAQSFLSGGYELAAEIQYFDSGRMIAVGLIDLTPVGMSSVYFYHDPACRKAAIGVHSILVELEYCRAHSVPHLYLGYWIARCPSMAYKSNYDPHELLERYVGDNELPDWRLAGPSPPADHSAAASDSEFA
jgi:arginyl-tRNA--protein-N-Asp/Glu arginylyltransferase